MSASGVSKGTFARVVPPCKAAGGGGCLGGKDSVRGCGQIMNRLSRVYLTIFSVTLSVPAITIRPGST